MCQKTGAEPFPFTYQKVARLMVYYFKSVTPPCGRSLPGIVSALVSVATSLEMEFLPKPARRRLTKFNAGLIQLSAEPVRKAMALTLPLIERLMKVAPITNLPEVQWITFVLVGHDAMLRMDDVLHRSAKHAKAYGAEASEQGTPAYLSKLRKRNIEWYPNKSAVLWVPQGKNKVKVNQPALILNSQDPLSSGTWLQRYWELMHMDSQPPEALLFPKVDSRNRVNRLKPQPSQWFIDETRRRARLGGMSEQYVLQIRGHSLRSGGVVDYLLAQFPEAWIKRQGRWLGDAFRMYFRLTRSSLSEMSVQLMRRVDS